MAQKLFPDNIPKVVRASSTTLSLASTHQGMSTRATIGGQQYKLSSSLGLSTATSGINGIDTGAFAVSSIYNIFLVQSSGTVGLIISLATAPIGFSSYKFLGKLISTSGAATISHVMNVGERFVEYSFNTSVTDANDTTLFGYGAAGQSVPATTFTGTRLKRCRFLMAITNTDNIRLTMDANNTGKFQEANGDTSDADGDKTNTYIQQGASTYGIGGILAVAASSTDMDVAIGQYRVASSGTYAAAGGNWVAGLDHKWRLEKHGDFITGP